MEIFCDINNLASVKSIVYTRYKVYTKTVQGWFKSKQVQTEDKIESVMCIFNNGILIEKEKLSFSSFGNLRTQYKIIDGRLIESSVRTMDGGLRETTLNEYNGTIIKKTTIREYDKQGRCTGITMCLYDSQGQEIECSTKYTIYKMRYNALGQLVEKTQFDARTKDYEKRIVYQYGTDGYVNEQTTFDKTGRIKRNLKFKYNSKGQEIQCIINDKYIESLDYDCHGNLIWMEWYPNEYGGYRKAITTEEYVYDAYGNAIEEREYRDGKYRFLTIRKIEYDL